MYIQVGIIEVACVPRSSLGARMGSRAGDSGLRNGENVYNHVEAAIISGGSVCM